MICKTEKPLQKNSRQKQKNSVVPSISIVGAREHNLQNISLQIPRGQLTAVTGPSGSGKSSLAFDTVFAEGQRQFIESLSFDTRRLLKQLRRPDADSITGLPPTVAVDQRGRTPSKRSTVATLTEVYDYLRLLYARCGTAHCCQCGQEIHRQSIQQILNAVLRLPEGSRLMLLAPILQEGIAPPLTHYVKAGFVRCRIDGELIDLEPLPQIDDTKPHRIEVVVDRLVIKDSIRERLWESLQLALKESSGSVIVCNEKEKNVWQDIPFSTRYACAACQISYQELEPRTFSFNSPYGACEACGGTGCAECNGSRLRREARYVTVADKRLEDIGALTLDEALVFFQTLTLPEEQHAIAEPLLEQILHRLRFLNGIGLDYLTLNRQADTLSGGEYQRVRLATALGSGLTGVCYILDEPSIGLHPVDNKRLIECLHTLREQGNTVIVVEHDDTIISAADYVIEIGPGAGKFGGKIVYEGKNEWIIEAENRQGNAFDSNTNSQLPLLTVHNASLNNLKDLTVSFPLQKLIGVTGVSGSGKSTLVNETLVPLVKDYLQHGKSRRRPEGILTVPDKQLDKLVVIDQSPLGRSGRGNAATYCGVFGEIRQLFAETRDAKRRGYRASRFSFNNPGGRCEHCRGRGELIMENGEWRIKTENRQDDVSDSNTDSPFSIFNSQFLCPVCNGMRFNRQTLTVRYRGKSIADVLNMTIDAAAEFFANFQTISRLLRSFQQIGLGYLTLGQPSSQLSGGEAQRVKLAAELAKTETGKTLYVLDEPTAGLHRTDVRRLLDVLVGLVQRGNTVIVIEHNTDVIRSADYIIELGPAGGKKGGHLINDCHHGGFPVKSGPKL
ncbi:MAG: ATP-binding cassette domain-containing protein [Planctomycetaceae bacterium]|nr:ATP-binding cassette domain-containing protein [Planctomycetaceae bacterium]